MNEYRSVLHMYSNSMQHNSSTGYVLDFPARVFANSIEINKIFPFKGKSFILLHADFSGWPALQMFDLSEAYWS